MTSAAAPDSSLNQTVDFYADRFLAVVAKLAERDAAIQEVRREHPRCQSPTSEHYYCEPENCDRAGEGELEPWCDCCSDSWPCGTIRALDGTE